MKMMMPVEVICEKCANCPEIDINTFTKSNIILTGVNDKTGTVENKIVSETTLRCANYEKCQAIYDAVFKETKEEKSKSPAKPRTTTKKPTAKTATRKKQA